MGAAMRVCTVCGEPKPREAFALSKRAKDGLHTFCKACKSAKSRAWYHATSERQKARGRRRYQTNGREMRAAALRWYETNRAHALELKREWAIRTAFGMTLKEYDALVVAQGGSCALCRKPPERKGRRPLHVDHCHDTGVVRGLLCRSCNVGLGHFKDSPSLLRAAAAYLEAASRKR